MSQLEFNPNGTSNVVCDISHYNDEVDFHKVKSAGIHAIIHKATQSGGRTFYHEIM